MKTYDAFHMENSGDPMKKLSSNGTDILDKNFSKYLVDVARLSLFFKIPENAHFMRHWRFPKNKFSRIFCIVIEKRRYQLYLLLSLPGVVVGVLGGAVDSAAVGGEVGSALHSSKSQQSTLQDARSPLWLRLLHTKSDEQRIEGKQTLTLSSVIRPKSFLTVVTVEQLKSGSQVTSSSSLAHSSAQMKHRRRVGEPLPPSVKTNWFNSIMACGLRMISS